MNKKERDNKTQDTFKTLDTKCTYHKNMLNDTTYTRSNEIS